MPQNWNNILIVTENELIPRFYSSINSLGAIINRDERKGYGVNRVQRGCRNRKMLIEFDSLPPYIKDELGDPRKVGHILEKYFTISKTTVDFYSTYTFPGKIYLKDHLQEEYITNASVLEALIRLKEDRIREIITKGGVVKHLFQTLLNDAISFNPILKKKWNVEHTLPQSEKRFKETFNDFVNDSYVSLISGKSRNQNAKKVNDQLIQLLNNMFGGQKHKPSYAEVAGQYNGFLDGYVEIINNETSECYDPKDFKPISESTIKHYLSSWEQKIGNEAKRSGDRQKLMQKFKPYHSLEHPKYASSIISVDDRQPPFEYEKGKRVWFYNAIDLGSEAIICWVYGKTKEGIITDFYRQLVRNCHAWNKNIPIEIECESSLNSSFKDGLLKEGNMFEYVRIEANNARGKRIEAYFKPLRYGLEKKREGWIPRPFAKLESNQEGSTPVPIIPYPDIINGCLRDIETWNNMPNSIYPEKTRWEIYMEKQHPETKPANYKRILPFIGYKTETSCRAGIIALQGGKFLLGDNGTIYTGENLINLMKQVEGRNIDIYWLDDNDGNVFKALIYFNNEYICEALPKPTYNKARIEQTPESMEFRTLMSKYTASVDGYMNCKKKLIDNVTVIDNRSLTLNNKFSIFNNVKKEVSVIDNEVEVLPEVIDEDFNTVETNYKSSLKDRF